MVGFERNSRIAHAARAAAGCGLFALMLAWSGCGQPTTETASPADPATADADPHAVPAHDDGGQVSAAMGKLSPEDRALAEAQKVCAVSGEPLGSMGTPYKVEHNGQVAFLCCDGCLQTFESDPEMYLAKLKGGAEAGADGATEPAEGGDAEPAAAAPADGA